MCKCVACVACVACLDGFAAETWTCMQDAFLPPNYADCNKYCPYTFTVRAIPRQLTDGDEVRARRERAPTRAAESPPTAPHCYSL